jgi:hypothetical protein
VRELARALRDRGVRVWLDEDELIPGRPWQEALEEIIRTTRTAAVLVGKDGLGPWEIPEMRACLSEFVDRRMPVIPVLLPGAPQKPELPLFLKAFTWVDLRGGITQGLDRLEWGITGRKPDSKREPSSGPRLHNLPFLSIGDLLKGRDNDLQDLDASLQSPSHRQVIHGLGGIGKTRLAVEYAWRYGDRYWEGAFFVRADSKVELRSGLARLAGISLLHLLSVQYTFTEDEIAEVVIRHLQGHSRWLLILDNVDTEEAAQAVREILPRLGNGHVLVTSRLAGWLWDDEERSLTKLSSEEATQFLLERTMKKRIQRANDLEKASELARILDGLPLALEQAAAYIAHCQIPFSTYLENWQLRRATVLNWFSPIGQHLTPVAVTWQKTFDQLGPTARAILRLCAYLSPDPIPLEMFEKERTLSRGQSSFSAGKPGRGRSDRMSRRLLGI